ncbi:MULTISPECIES: HigA family addiction module antitoxin [Nocardia]|uniref:HigA family addiction module antitoxin n=1 Tax=Nocardia TaxID=1817 RepID=UPI00366F1FB8
MNEYRGLPAQAFPAGDYLRDEIEARGWTVSEFAQIVGRPQQAISEILNGRKEITAETALEIAAATDTEASTWLRLQNTYRLWQLSRIPNQVGTTAVSRRARLAKLVPMPELRRRGIIPAGADLDAEEAAVLDLLQATDLEAPPPITLAARRSEETAPISPPQLAWIACVRREALRRTSPLPEVGDVSALASEVVRRAQDPASLVRLPELFAQFGIRLLYVQPFKSGKIDGGAYLDDSGTPVIGISGRIQRIDSVVFTLLHELAHLHLDHLAEGITLDSDVCAATENQAERDADRTAMRWALPDRIDLFPPISKRAVVQRASEMGVHPGLIVGRLQYQQILPWTHLRELTPNVRGYLSAWS